MDPGLILGILGTILTVVGFPVTYYWGRRGRRRPDFRYSIDFDVLLSKNDNFGNLDLGLTYGDQVVDSLSRTRIAIWNNSGDTIKGEDIVSSDPFRLVISEGSILQAHVTYQSRPQCNISVIQINDNPTEVGVTFDFLDAGDGAVLELKHQGEAPALVSGTIRGVEFHRRSNANLSPSAMEAVISGSVISRIKYAFGNKILRVFSLIIPIGMFITVGLISLRQALKEPRLVSIDAYNLETIEGQKEFLRAAADAGLESNASSFVGFGASVFMLIMVVFFIYVMQRTIVPASIARDRLISDPKETGEVSPSGEPESK